MPAALSAGRVCDIAEESMSTTGIGPVAFVAFRFELQDSDSEQLRVGAAPGLGLGQGTEQKADHERAGERKNIEPLGRPAGSGSNWNGC